MLNPNSPLTEKFTKLVDELDCNVIVNAQIAANMQHLDAFTLTDVSKNFHEKRLFGLINNSVQVIIEPLMAWNDLRILDENDECIIDIAAEWNVTSLIDMMM